MNTAAGGWLFGPWPTRLLRGFLLAAASVYLLAYVGVASLRMSYPFDLECMEGTHLDQVNRILSGEPMYVRPTLAYAPVMFPPVYFYVSALTARVVGPGYAPMRLVSFLSSLGCFYLIYRFVLRETSSSFCAFLSAGFFAGAFRFTDYWLDIARVDSLCLFILLGAAYTARFQTGLVSVFYSSLLFGLAFLTKQTALMAAVPLALYFALMGAKELAVFVGSGGALAAAVTVYLNHRSGGWYNFYVFDVPRNFFTLKHMLVLFWTRHVFPEMGIACGLSLFFLLTRARGPERRVALFYGLLGAGVLCASWMHSMGWGAGPNGRLPSYALLCITLGLGAAAILARLRQSPGAECRVLELCLYSVLAIQFCSMFYNPLQVIPGQSGLEAGSSLVARIAQSPGQVYVPLHSHLPVLAGKPSSIHAMNLRAILETSRQDLTFPLRQEVDNALGRNRFSMIVQDSDWTQEQFQPVFNKQFLENYEKRETILYPDSGTLRCYSGLQARPEFIYLPKAAGPASGLK